MWAKLLTDLLAGLTGKLVEGLTTWFNQKQLMEDAAKADALKRQMASIAEAAKRERALQEAITTEARKPPLSIDEWNANAP